jgi:hypothetical protein
VVAFVSKLVGQASGDVGLCTYGLQEHKRSPADGAGGITGGDYPTSARPLRSALRASTIALPVRPPA